jgi:hypothetical protein
MVPNQQSVDWPQAQWASLYLRPGSPSFQPYRYDKNDVPLAYLQPTYTAHIPPALVRGSRRPSGPGGDIAKLPFGGLMSSLGALMFGPSKRVRAQMEAKRRLRAQDRSKGWGWRQPAPTPTPVGPPAVRMGARVSHQPIPAGIPHTSTEFVPPEPRATAGLTNLYGGLALQNSGCVGCGDFGELGPWDSVTEFYTNEEGGWNWGYIGGTALIVASLWIALTKRPNEPFLDAAKLKAAQITGGRVFNNPKKRRRKKSRMSKAARSRAAKKGGRTRRRRSR